MNSFHLDPHKTALVVIDLQKGIVATPTVPYSSTEIMQKSNLLAKRFREKGATVVYVRVDMADFLQLPVDVPSRDPGAPPPPASASELASEAGFQSGDLLITKRHWGAFAGTELEQLLKQRGINTVVLTGISTNVGVEQLFARVPAWVLHSSSWRMRVAPATQRIIAWPSRKPFHV